VFRLAARPSFFVPLVIGARQDRENGGWALKTRTLLLPLLLCLAVSSVAEAGSVLRLENEVVPGGSGQSNIAVFALVPKLMGDANRDGVVDVTDYLALKWGMSGTVPATWANGDFNLDGKVNLLDLLIIEESIGAGLRGNSLGGGESPPHAPEPLTVLGLVLGLGGVAGYLRKRKLA
jgi:hypothetical protein